MLQVLGLDLISAQTLPGLIREIDLRGRADPSDESVL